MHRVHQVGAEELGETVGSFDTLLLMGNNFGIFGTPERTRAALSAWSRRLGPGARIVAESTTPHGGGVPTLDTGYRRANRRQGRMAGQLRLRTRYKTAATPWFWWLYVSPAEMRALVRGTGWRLSSVVASAPVEPYVALLERHDGARPR